MTRRRRLDPAAAGSLALTALPLVAFAAAAWSWRWTHDDGFITLRVVEQVVAGNGPVFNEGQRVEAYTSPAHLGLLVVLRVLLGWAVDVAWLGAIATLTAAVAGLALAAVGAARLARAGGATGVLVPLGLLVPVALPPMWEYATAGLETGLAVGWIGATFCVLAGLAARGRPVAVARRRAEAGSGPAPNDLDAANDLDTANDVDAANGVERSSGSGPAEGGGARRGADAPARLWPVAVLVGLGPLVRPELAVVAVAWTVVLCRLELARDRSWWRLAAVAAAVPVAYELFRMAYFGALVPTTALAKQAGGARWGQGWFYVTNTAGPYVLLVPLAAVAVWLVAGRPWSLRRTFGGDDGRSLAAATVVGALVYGLYVVRVGGDYMHGRMLLPPLVALCCPVAVVALPEVSARRARGIVLAASAAVALWAVGVGTQRRAPIPGELGPTAIAAQRPFYVGLADTPHPVTVDDYRRSGLWEAGQEARAAHEAGDDVLITRIATPTVTLPVRTELPPGSGTWLFTDGIGVFGLVVGRDVPVIDHHGLAHALAARMPPLEPRVLPGHEKELPQAWALAEAGGAGPVPGSDRFLAAVARDCGDARRVLDATEANLTLGRLWSNLRSAPALTFLRIPDDPAKAAATCEGTWSVTTGVGGSGP